MRHALKPALTLALVGLLLIVAAGCGGGSGGGGGSAGSSDIKGKITVWDFEYESFPKYTEAVKKIDAQFERLHPGVTVERVAEPYENYEAIYRAAFTAHEGPDVMLMQPGASGVLSFKPGLEQLNDRISPEMNKEITQWESVTADLAPEGERFGVPIALSGWVFYYNKKLFAQAGLPTDFQPKTWAELRQAGEKLKAAGIQPFTGGNKEGYENSWWFSVGFQAESTQAQSEELAAGEMSFTDPAIAKAFQPEIEMEEAGLYPSDRFTTPLFTEGYPRFAEGRGAMTLGFWTTTGYWGEFVPSLGEENVGIFFPPGSHPVGTISAFALSIPKFAQNKDAAWALIEYESSKKGIETLDRVGGFLPNRNDVSLSGAFPTQAHELVDASRDPGAGIAPFAMLPSSVAFGTMATEMNQVLQGRTSLESAQKAMQETKEKTAVE